jgi:tetratricopeptide (TPR) repeat protein
MTKNRDIGGASSAPSPRVYLDIDAAMRRGDMPSAMALARGALVAGLRHPVLFNLRAYGHESGGDFAAACADLEAALALAPGSARLLNELGRCRTGNGEFAEAVAACAAAIAAEPRLASAHHNKALAHEQLGELDAAWEDYRRAVALDPALHDASARLAGLAARRGDHAEARALAETVLAVLPKHAIASFAHIVADLAEGRYAEAERRARAVAADPDVFIQARLQAENFIADALDGQGRAAEAFSFYTQANDGLKSLFRSRFEAAGKETGRPLARRLLREFEAIPAASWSPPGPDESSSGLVFLMGFPRPGTTLLGQILASHPRIATIEEKPLLGDALTAFVHTQGGLSQLAALSAAEVERYRGAFWRNVRDRGVEPRDKVVVDQTPLNTLHLPVIAKLFPEARVVFALRDPRDVVLSCFRRLFVPNDYVYEFLSLEGTARFYDEAMRLAALFRERLALRVLDVRNEDLAADFDGQTRALCDYLGLAWDDAMRDFARVARTRRIATPSAQQIMRGISRDGIGHWRAYANELAPVMQIIAPWIERFGYA